MVWKLDRSHGLAQRLDGGRSDRAHRRYRLLVLAGADGFSADRGPRLYDRARVPDGASLERTQKALDKVFEIARQTPGVARVVNIAGVSALDNSATLSSAGVAYI